MEQFNVPEMKDYTRKPSKIIEVTENDFNTIMACPIQSQLHNPIDVPGKTQTRGKKDADVTVEATDGK